ncbi:34615_t:CDS:2, partial [Racocetra persica]
LAFRASYYVVALLRRCAVASSSPTLIFESTHKNYGSEINLAITGIKYSLARSKTIIDIDNHIISSGGYTKFINWLESLAVENEPLPKGLLFLAFDNEQRVTSFVALNISKNDYAQFTIAPWTCNSIPDDQYEKLYYVLPEMQAELDLELKVYLSSILEELVIEKNKKINTIDAAVKNQKGVGDTLATLQAESANEVNQTNNPTQSKPF